MIIIDKHVPYFSEFSLISKIFISFNLNITFALKRILRQVNTIMVILQSVRVTSARKKILSTPMMWTNLSFVILKTCY